MRALRGAARRGAARRGAARSGSGWFKSDMDVAVGRAFASRRGEQVCQQRQCTRRHFSAAKNHK